jgi:hypothetical protein
LRTLQAVDLLLVGISNAGIDFAKFHALRDKARAENRQLTVEELRMLAAEGQAAIDSIMKNPEEIA